MRYLLAILVGLALGAALTFYFFVGAPRAKQSKLGAQALQAPDAGGDPPGTIVLTFDEKFFDTLLGTIFRDLSPPAFKLGANSPDAAGGVGDPLFVNAQGGCANQINITQEGSGSRTTVSLQNGEINAPLAFNGATDKIPFAGCFNFKGAAQATVSLSFNREQQTLYGQINVMSVNLEGASPIVEPFVTTAVQTAINQKVNPLVIMRGQQLTLNVPVQASGGTVRAQARDVRAEIKDGALRLHISYDFAGAKGVVAPQQPQG
jgi:hypothetical protein